MEYDYEIAVIGAGSGGLTVAIGLAKAGKKVVLIERGLIGGDCTNYGCIPSKSLIDVAQSGQFADMKSALDEVRYRRKKIQEEETPEKIESHGLKVILGFASFKSDHCLDISPPSNLLLVRGGIGQEITAEKIIISTGSHPVVHHIPGIDKNDILTNKEIFEVEENIQNLIVIGGGYIGCELAESFAALGVNVTIIQRNNRLIPREEPQSSQLLETSFESNNIKIEKSVVVEMAEGKNLIIKDKIGGESRKIPFDKILFATGRKANVNNLGLEKAGIDYDVGGIIVDRFNRTNQKHIFALGDCVSGQPQFTHWANAQGRAVIQTLLIPYFKKSTKKLILPSTLYTHLEVARVGKTHEELLKIYDKEEIITKVGYFSDNDRSKITLDTRGFVLLHLRRLSGKILGGTIMGKNAGELLPILTQAMQNNISAYTLSSQIFAYPTRGELIKKVADSFVISTLGNIKGEIKYILKAYILQIVTFILWGTLIYTFFYYKISSGMSYEQLALTLYNYIAGNPYGMLIYIIAYAIRPFILFPATLMTFMSGALFGFWGGFVATMIGENLSAMNAYFLGKVFGKKLLNDDTSGGLVQIIKKKVNSDPFMNVLTMRFLFFPFDLTNYACGFLRVKFKSFVGATVLGIIPGASVFILAGAAFYHQELTSFSDALKNIDVNMLYYAAGLFAFTLLFSKFLKKKGAEI